MIVLKPIAEVAAGGDPRIPPELASLADATHPWTSYVAYVEGREAVGACAFKHAPDANHDVEIAYLTFPEFERRGYGTAITQSLIDIATKSGKVRHVLARTLKEENASVRICRRLNFAFDGEVIDADDGVVWQWRKPIILTRR